MANLKLDLLNKLRNDKYYEELELVRLAQEPNINYKMKIDNMGDSLAIIALLNAEMGLVEQYFQEPVPQVQGTPQPAPQQPTGQAHQGQSHGE